MSDRRRQLLERDLRAALDVPEAAGPGVVEWLRGEIERDNEGREARMKPEDIWIDRVTAKTIFAPWSMSQPVSTWTYADVTRDEYARIVHEEGFAPETVWRGVWVERVDIDETPSMWRARLHLLLGPPEEIERRRAFAATRCPTCGKHR